MRLRLIVVMLLTFGGWPLSVSEQQPKERTVSTELAGHRWKTAEYGNIGKRPRMAAKPGRMYSTDIMKNRSPGIER